MATKSTRPALLEKTYKAKMDDKIFYDLPGIGTLVGVVYKVEQRRVAVRFSGTSPRDNFKLYTNRIFTSSGQICGASRIYVDPELTA